MSKSPLYAQFSETISGRITIRAYGVEESWAERNITLLDANTRAGFHNQSVNRWLSLRMEQLGAGLCLCAGFVAVAMRESLSPSVLVSAA